MQIVLVGYMGSGKSAVGRVLAEATGLDFTDLDNYIESREALSIPQIFEQRGELYFRKREHELLKEFLEQHQTGILALGGGTPCYAGNMDLLLGQTPHVFYLQLGVGQLVKRLEPEQQGRPLIAHLDKEELPEFIGKHLFERNPFYDKAHHVIRIQEQSAEEVVQQILTILSAKTKQAED
ncbi:shikimate kinase [Robiginitalea myxolifaciens]|uniref:Shikimate kinase n=1 Tax=Robiginitalea myxolifaciens TaxID=400055 RepID=A0A1I6H5U5_9FLAO|nr:shikimate kinase [Robiginitalea myxolifaciens]SFR49798.1 shikimate kinase [Robiginitalea myxolifaciens]